MRDYYPGDETEPEFDRTLQQSAYQMSLDRYYYQPPPSGDVAYLPTLKVNGEARADDQTGYSRELNLVTVYEESKPSVVRIKGDKMVNKDGQMVPGEVTGSGFFVTPDGKLATDYHVVKDASNLQIKTSDGTVYRATVDTIDPSTDLAILKVENNNPLKFFPILPLGESQSASEQAAIAMGHPHGWQDTFVSPGRFRTTKMLRDVLPEIRGGALPGENLNRLMQTYEINVQSGNSGGPLLDRNGRVVGVIGLSNSKDTALATPVEDLLRLLNHSQKIGRPPNIPTATTIDLDATRRFNQKLSGGYGSITNYTESFPGSLQTSPSNRTEGPSVVPGSPRQDIAPFRLPEKGGASLSTDDVRGSELPSVSHSLVHGVNAFTKLRALSGGKPGVVGGLFSVAAGGYDLVYNDISQFKTSWNSGDSKRIFSSGLQLAADGLLIGGGIASMGSRFAVPGAVASLAGSGIKLAGDGLGYSKLLK